MTTITIPKPDDFHLHLRNDIRTSHAAPENAKQFARALIMPNLKPPVTTTAQALEYQQYLQDIEANCQYLMTLYFTDNTTPEIIQEAAQNPNLVGVKLYPAGATTNSDHGVTDYSNIEEALSEMEKLGLPLLLHGEVTGKVDFFEREARFITEKLIPLHQKYPKLKIVCEHITTKAMLDFVLQAPENIAATLTPQHLLVNRNALFNKGLNPHNFCLPVLKTEQDRQAIVQALLSNNPKLIAGTDSAPHLKNTKETSCGCAGCYTTPNAISLYAEVFEQNGGLESQKQTFINFMAKNGAKFYRLPETTQTITLQKTPHKIADEYQLSESQSLIPFWAGKSLSWSIKAS